MNPKRILNGVLAGYGYRVERIVDYGQHSLNVFELAVEALHPEDPAFFFLQVGAHDGRRGDPIRPFIERYHWRGLLLEPQPDVFDRLARNYQTEPQLILENAAIAGQDGFVSLYRAQGSSLRASVNRDTVARHSGAAAVAELRVPALTFQTLRARHGLRRVDLMVVDTEGFDYEVVRMAVGAGLDPGLIRYEHVHLSSNDRRACANLLATRGYRLLRDGTDTIAMHTRGGAGMTGQ